MNDWEKDFHEAIVKRMDKNIKIFTRAIEGKNYSTAFAAATLIEKCAEEAKDKLREGQRKFDDCNTGMKYVALSRNGTY